MDITNSPHFRPDRMDQEELFNLRRAEFGKKGRANELSLSGFLSLSDDEANELIRRVADFPVKAELRTMRNGDCK